MKNINSSWTNRHGDPIDYEIDYPESAKALPIVLFLHGFKAFKDWGFYPYLCNRLAKAGSIAIRFSYSLSGVIDSRRVEYDVDKFARNTTSREIEDSKLVLEQIIDTDFLANNAINWNGDIYLVGHSKGGANSLIIANDYSQIKKVSTLAAVSKIFRFSERQKDLWLKNGKFEFTMNQTKQRLRLNSSYLEDLIENNEKYNLPKVVNTLNKPLQIIHGKQDVTVNIKEGYELAYEYQDKSKLQFVILEKSGHGFGAKHPFTKTNDGLEEMISRIISFFELEQ